MTIYILGMTLNSKDRRLTCTLLIGVLTDGIAFVAFKAKECGFLVEVAHILDNGKTVNN